MKTETEEKIAINCEQLQIAKEFCQLSQSELAEKVRLTQAAVSKILNGLTQEISKSLLKDFSKATGFPESFFKQKDAITTIGSSALYNRGRKKILVSDMKWIQANVNIVRSHVRTLLDGVRVSSRMRLPEYPIEEGTAGSIARKVRAYWNIPSGPVRDITKRVEDAGVLVIPMDFRTRHLDGTCIWLADCPPLIFVNESLSADRYRWTIAHELGHLVMHSSPRETQEDEADSFASEFLMPSSDIKPFLRKKLSIQLFAELKLVWGTSMAALARRALDLKLMSPRQYKYYIINIRKLGLPEPNQSKKEEPTAWRELLEYNVDKLNLKNRDDLGLHLKAPKDIADRYWSTVLGKPHLSVVG